MRLKILKVLYLIALLNLLFSLYNLYLGFTVDCTVNKIIINEDVKKILIDNYSDNEYSVCLKGHIDGDLATITGLSKINYGNSTNVKVRPCFWFLGEIGHLHSHPPLNVSRPSVADIHNDMFMHKYGKITFSVIHYDQYKFSVHNFQDWELHTQELMG